MVRAAWPGSGYHEAREVYMVSLREDGLVALSIYKITCSITNKIYVGQTKKSLDERFKQHLRKAKKSLETDRWGICPRLFAAINKHGAENFSIELLDIAQNADELNEKEEHWIRKLNTVDSGYNASYGGDSRRLSEESLIKLSKSKLGNSARTGMVNSPEVRAFHSNRMTGAGNPMTGKPSLHRKRIICSNGQVYESLRHASIELKLWIQNISKVLNGKRTHTGGYKFEIAKSDAKERG